MKKTVSIFTMMVLVFSALLLMGCSKEKTGNNQMGNTANASEESREGGEDALSTEDKALVDLVALSFMTLDNSITVSQALDNNKYVTRAYWSVLSDEQGRRFVTWTAEFDAVKAYKNGPYTSGNTISAHDMEKLKEYYMQITLYFVVNADETWELVQEDSISTTYQLINGKPETPITTTEITDTESLLHHITALYKNEAPWIPENWTSVYGKDVE